MMMIPFLPLPSLSFFMSVFNAVGQVPAISLQLPRMNPRTKMFVPRPLPCSPMPVGRTSVSAVKSLVMGFLLALLSRE